MKNKLYHRSSQPSFLSSPAREGSTSPVRLLNGGWFIANALMGVLLGFIFMAVNALIISLDLISYGFSGCCLGGWRGYET